MARIAHYVASTHWDREWYESFQGFRMRLVSMLDEVFETFETDPDFTTFVMDGQSIPANDYLEIKPEMRARIEAYVKNGRLKLGPWYVLPDEWLVSGESLIRNLEMGIELADSFGAPSSRAGFMCDMFGHTGQMPQIFKQFGIPAALVWRGTHEKEHQGHFNWRAPDGTTIPAYRFGKIGYCSYCIMVRGVREKEPYDLDNKVEKMVEYVRYQAGRSELLPILLFDGGDHLEIDTETSLVIARANERLASEDITIIHSDLDRYMEEVLSDSGKINKTLIGELRETGRDPGSEDEQWLIPGVLSSRIHLKQRNAECEDELCLWAEPFSTFAAECGQAYPTGYLHTAWKHLLENHPHDSICGCSIDQVHQDMIYRFDQSFDIASHLTSHALRKIAAAAAPQTLPDGSLMLAVFNHTAEPLDEPVDIDIPLPTDWSTRFMEFFGFEEKFSFIISNADGEEIPYQLVGQQLNHMGFKRPRYRFPTPDNRHIVSVCAHLKVPSCGYTTLIVRPEDKPARYLGTMASSHRAIENDILHVEVNTNGTITVLDKRNGEKYDQLLTFEDCSDIGDGWYHGVAVNDRKHYSTACPADVAVIADGIYKSTLRITVTMMVPQRFDFRNMKRCDEAAPLKIVSDVTLRKDSDRIEVTTTIDNTILDHRIRVLFPLNQNGDSYLSDAAFDVVKRPVALVEDNAEHKELDVETRPQITWTAFTGDRSALAIVSRGLPESAVTDTKERTLALTLLRSFRRAVLDNDNPGGQIQGKHTFRYDIVPIHGGVPVKKLFLLGQRILGATRTVDIAASEFNGTVNDNDLPGSNSYLAVEGDVVVTSIQRRDDDIIVRLFNPLNSAEIVELKSSIPILSVQCVTLDGNENSGVEMIFESDTVKATVPPKRIVTFILKKNDV